ncbi:MAG: radical SAM protein [Bacillota bacterium]|jgi:uncharacterized radical SAM superfamily protein
MLNITQAYKSISDSLYLPQETKSLMEQAWKIRTANFPMEISAVTPVKTGSVSVTGTGCALNCAHCGKHYLKGMITLDAVLSGEGRSKYTSYLISGGCTTQGKVPLLPHLEQLRQLKKSARLNLHTGLIDREEACSLTEVADAVSFDFVCSREILQKVYGLDKNVSDYLESYRALVECFGTQKVIPHITIGLDRGQVTHEVKAVELLASEGISRLVILVLIPTPGTSFQRMPAPNLVETAAAIARIRALIPTTPIFLGCMRPGGAYRRQLDLLALRCGINKIVQPAPNIFTAARELGLEVKTEKECCAL